MRLVMNHLVFEEIGTLNEINDLRNQYLDKLLEAQKLYLELLIRNSRVFVIKSHGRRIGYFLLGDGGSLLEYYVTRDNIDQVDTLLGMIIQKFSIQKALCKSFDHTLLSCYVGFQKKVNVIGIHFREYEEKAAHPIDEGITIRPAKAEDEQQIIEVNEEIFGHEEDIREYIRNEQIFLLEKDKEIIGFCIHQQRLEQ
jgi:hypothetical protein